MTADQLTSGQLLADYEIESVAGAGGMGIVYRATQRSLGRVVALKVIRDEIASADEYRERFLREARLAASVDHPNIVTVYDVGDEDGRLFLAMQWIDGEDLKRVLESSGRLSPNRAVTIATQVAGALDAVHSTAGLVHRDVKPANVLLGQLAGKDHAYLTDFGVAKPSDAADHLTRTGWVVGTAGYLSPEQIRGQDPGPRSDLYALGCLFFEMLTGQVPFRADNEMALRWAHANDPRPQASTLVPALGVRYDSFLETALAIDPEHRFASGTQFAEALTAAHAGDGAPAPQETAVTAIAVPHTPTAIGPPTPMPPSPQTPPPPGAYPAYAYGTPTPPPQQSSRSGNPLALILLALVAFAGIAVGALAAAGVLSKGSSTHTTSPAAAAAAAASAKPKTHAKAKPLPARTSPCGGDLSVGPNTSCAFAKNVEEAYDHGSGGETNVTAYSPATGQTYPMHCTAEPPHVCTGGKGAAVYFTSGPRVSSPNSAPAASPPPAAGLQSCDQNVSASQVTSCPFAENVFVSYWRSYRSNGVQSPTTVSAYSSVKHQNYEMTCLEESGTVNCSGGNNAFVTFPLHAVEAYEGPG